MQGYLGFDEGMVRRQVELRVKSGSIDPVEYEGELRSVEGTAEWGHDGVMVAGAILRFSHGDDVEV